MVSATAAQACDVIIFLCGPTVHTEPMERETPTDEFLVMF